METKANDRELAYLRCIYGVIADVARELRIGSEEHEEARRAFEPDPLGREVPGRFFQRVRESAVEQSTHDGRVLGRRHRGWGLEIIWSACGWLLESRLSLDRGDREGANEAGRNCLDALVRASVIIGNSGQSIQTAIETALGREGLR